MLQVGIVGLPNVGKSTLFNAMLRRQQALVANYPFATIEPNIGIVPVPDRRLSEIAEITMAEEKMESLPPLVPATVQFVDIAGLVKGAATGAGLGNKFLAHIREVDLICEVVRAFPDENIVREGSVEPDSDVDVLNTELILADLQTMQNQNSKVKSQNSNLKFKSAIEKLETMLNQGNLAREVTLDEEEADAAKELQLLTMKPIIYVLNVNTVTKWPDLDDIVKAYTAKDRAVAVIDAKLEADLSELAPDEQEEYLASLGVTDSGVNQLIRLSYQTLGLISFFTTGVKETRAWTIKEGTKAPAAAGVIHSDFESNFIKAEVVEFSDFLENGGWKKSRELGKVRFEGKEYIVDDADVIEFKVGV